ALDAEAKRYADRYTAAGGVSLDNVQARDQQHYDRGMQLLGNDPAAALRELVASEAAAREVVRLSPMLADGYTRLQSRYEALANARKRLKNVDGESAALSARVNAAQLAAWLSPPETLIETSNTLRDARTKFAQFLDRTN